MDDVAKIRTPANIGAPISPQEMERMAKRRFQNPQPQRRGAWWTMRVWRDEFVDGKHARKQQRVRLAAATLPEREVKKVATEYLRPLNQGLETLVSATNFEHFIETIYKPVVKPLMATTNFDRTRGVLDNYLASPHPSTRISRVVHNNIVADDRVVANFMRYSIAGVVHNNIVFIKCSNVIYVGPHAITVVMV